METKGTRLKKARKNKGYTQEVAAKKLGISNGTLSGYERDYRDPDTIMLGRMCELYEVKSDWVLGITNDPRQSLSEGDRELLTSIDLSDLELLQKFDFTYGTIELPNDIKVKALALLRTLLENEPHLKEIKKSK